MPFALTETVMYIRQKNKLFPAFIPALFPLGVSATYSLTLRRQEVIRLKEKYFVLEVSRPAFKQCFCQFQYLIIQLSNFVTLTVQVSLQFILHFKTNGFALFSGTDYDNDTYIAGYSRNHCHSQVIDDLTRIELYMIIILSNLWPPK